VGLEGPWVSLLVLEVMAVAGVAGRPGHMQ